MTTKAKKNTAETKAAAEGEELRLAYEVHTLAHLLLRHMAAGAVWSMNPVLLGGAPMSFQAGSAWSPGVAMPGFGTAPWGATPGAAWQM